MTAKGKVTFAVSFLSRQSNDVRPTKKFCEPVSFQASQIYSLAVISD